MSGAYETVETVRVSSADLANLLRERDHLRKQVKELQEASTKVADNSLARTVRAFHMRFGHPVAWNPTVPDEATVRFRLRLITEEYLELLDACSVHLEGDLLDRLRTAIKEYGVWDGGGNLQVDLPELVDAMGDLDYVVEGTRAVFGIDSVPHAAAIHAANMAKDPNGPDGKPVKPEGWAPPDHVGILIDHGWRPQ